MSTLDTPRSWTTSRTAEAVVVPRRHVLVIAILMCVPLPLLSLAATVVPLPQIVERAAVTFISIAAPVVRTEGSLIRQKAIPVRSVEVTHRQAERGSSAVSKPTTRTRSQTAVHVDAGGTHGKPAEPSGGAADEPAETGPPSTDGEPGPGASTDPPTLSAPNSGAGGSGSGSGSGGSGSGGGGSGNGTDPPGHGGADPGGGNGNADPTAPDPGSGSGSPPEPPPTSNRPPANGHGKP